MEKYAEQTQQEFEGWEEFINKPVDEKVKNFIRKDRIYDVIYAQQFDRPFLDYLCSLADSIRLLAKTKVGQSKLRHLLPACGATDDGVYSVPLWFWPAI